MSGGKASMMTTEAINSQAMWSGNLFSAYTFIKEFR